MNQINKEIVQFKAEISTFALFKENTNNNFKNVHDDMLNQEQIITNFSSKVSYALSDVDNKIKSFEGILNQELEKLKNTRDEVIRKMDIIDNKFGNKITEIDQKFFKGINKIRNLLSMSKELIKKTTYSL